MKIKKTRITIPLIITFVLSAGLLFGFDFDACRNEELQIITSPDRKRKAVVFQRDCGATTGFSTQVSLLNANDKLPNETGNAFIADTDNGKAPEGPGGGPEVKLQWAGERELIVKYDKRARVFRSEPSVEGVTIRYELQ